MLTVGKPGSGINISPVVIVGCVAEHVWVRGITWMSVRVTPDPPDNVDEALTVTGDVPSTLKQGLEPQVVRAAVGPMLARNPMAYDLFTMGAVVEG